jgi:NAD(P)-dependent dehydrogenase (short-subunit alcohol dehydrogenase family)
MTTGREFEGGGDRDRGSGGIGRAISSARAAGQVGINVNEGARGGRRGIGSSGGAPNAPLVADVSARPRRSAVDQAVASVGGLDVVVNNAGS